jgi:hypothetical protein
MLYAAFEEETALAEMAGDDPKQCAVATLTPLRDLNVVDFTSLPMVPSIFEAHELMEDGQDALRPELSFLHEFASAISKPIARDNRVHVDYIPTQVVTEFFRTSVRYCRKPLDGLVYSSARRPDGKNVVLFATQDDMLEETLPAATSHARASNGPGRRYDRRQPWIAMSGMYRVRTVPASAIV